MLSGNTLSRMIGINVEALASGMSAVYTFPPRFKTPKTGTFPKLYPFGVQHSILQFRKNDLTTKFKAVDVGGGRCIRDGDLLVQYLLIE